MFFNNFNLIDLIDLKAISTFTFSKSHYTFQDNLYIFTSWKLTVHAINYLINLLLVSFFLNFFFFLNYNNQLSLNNQLNRFLIFNHSEKEIGPVEDYLIFIILYIITIVGFIFSVFSLIILLNKFYLISFISLVLLSVLILTLPLNLFYDFGISFFSYIRGSAGSSNLLKEVIFDLISVFIVFIRFIIQNIRFIFIYSAIFELLEWTTSSSYNIFYFNFLNFFEIFSFKLIIISLINSFILYMYYFLHLLFLLLVQNVIYVGISAWLFFFLYSTKFLNKYEIFFIKK